MKLTFGKHKGKDLRTLEDRNYIEWVIENFKSGYVRTQFAQRLIQLNIIDIKKERKEQDDEDCRLLSKILGYKIIM